MVHQNIVKNIGELYLNIPPLLQLESNSYLNKYKEYLLETLRDKLKKHLSKDVIFDWKSNGELFLTFLELLKIKNTGKGNIDESMLKRLIECIHPKPLLQKDPMHRFIWEFAVMLDAELKCKTAKSMIGQVRSTFGVVGS